MKHLLTILLILSFQLSYCATFTWTGLGGNMDFADQSNWDSPPTGGAYEGDFVIGSGFSSVSNPILNVSGFIQSLSLTDAYIEINTLFTHQLNLDNSHANMDPVSGLYITIYNPYAIELTNGSHLQVDGNLWIQSAITGIRVFSNSVLEVNAGALLKTNGVMTGLHIDTGTFNNYGTYECASVNVMILADHGAVVNNNDRIEQLGPPSNITFVEDAVVLNNGSFFVNFGKLIIVSVKNNGVHVKNDSNNPAKTTFINHYEVYASPCTTNNCNPLVNGATLKVDPNACTDLKVGSILFIQAGPGEAPMPLPLNITTSTCVINNGTFSIPTAYPLVMLNTVLGPLSQIVGTGTVDNSNMTTVGNIRPGFSPGVITFMADYNNPGSTFVMELAGNGGAGATDGHDQIVFQGATNSASGVDLDLSYIDGFLPQVGDQFTIVSGLVSGTFNSITFPDDNLWNVNYNSGDITIELAAILTAGNVGIGTFYPASSLQVKGGDVYVETINSGVVLTDTNGVCYRITVETDGSLLTTVIPCPN